MNITLPSLTPGKWQTDRAGVNVIDPRPDERGYVLAHCHENNLRTLSANARAIAAVPAMLEALAFMWKYDLMLREKGGGLPSQLLRSIQDALLSAGCTITE